MSRRLAAFMAVALAALVVASLTAGLLYWALDSLRRRREAARRGTQAPPAPGLPWHNVAPWLRP